MIHLVHVFMNNKFYMYSGLLFMVVMINLPLSVYLYMTSSSIFIEWEVFNMMTCSVEVIFLFDWMSCGFASTVCFISSMIMVYSSYYMADEVYVSRFVALVYLFVLSMLLLIYSPNILSVLLGWDGLGLVSYCLVIFYQTSKSAAAGMITVLTNRLGDIAILLSITWAVNLGGWNFMFLQLSLEGGSWMMALLTALLVFAAITKSAQIPFSAWLPAAMAAPTPVSALVHSSTLVTAGVYLLVRFHYTLGFNLYLLILAVFTIFMSGVAAVFETDLKKVIALSTLSQLGVMMVTLSSGMVDLAFFHLVSHAMFKSLLFLCAGGFIHSNISIQDIRLMGGGLGLYMPLTSVMFLGSSLSLCGFPFLAGFYSKDLIIECFYGMESNFLIFFVLILATLLTFMYSFRLLFYMYATPYGVGLNAHPEGGINMVGPMIFLFFISLVVGSYIVSNYHPPVFLMLPLVSKLFLMVVGGGLCLGISIYLVNSAPEYTTKGVDGVISYFITSMWFLAGLATSYFTPSLYVGKKFLKFLDQGWAEELGAQGLHKVGAKGSFYLDMWGLVGVKGYLFLFYGVVLVGLLYSLMG
uniref:NADH-ubiquinone oxidoreductase chain 5 n=1 Tax=Podura aquatica TaxID=50589 RepID=Q6DVG0_9HEXA|nr:NADH dehydrogenase subunit 5 [Podura aquatica]AAT69339.1 NADH dehydrogenase subunit 5 [Podura aquatica]